ncbi:hypothetical protein [Nocardia goodfellowii]|uniref:DUF222 domain-containing protein n=1 Tax=Nocardia goodfellowii TaxID=882446 RepID=A0ABS4QQ30_9NOCA|nr:hypothetical protein [Nocardia goodfellowii]MBP2193804.1 hypothetical protein [Nocardia goodfellowii]
MTEDRTRGTAHDAHADGFAEFAEELKLLAEAVLERVEPVLRRTATDGQAQWAGCSWCPVCAAAALLRGEHHDVVAAIADHGTSIVTVLREALAGIPVEPVMPDPEDAPPHEDSVAEETSPAPPAEAEPSAGRGPGRKRSRYIKIPVTFKG